MAKPQEIWERMQDESSTPLDSCGGFWISSSGENEYGGECQLFRADFIVNEMPGRSEILIAARSVFHLYVNGRLCAVGALSHPGKKNYVRTVDINYLVQVGVNRIAVKVLNVNLPLSGFKRKDTGLWMQVYADGKLICSSDDKWCCRQAEGYSFPGLAQRIGGPLVEDVDLRNHRRDWSTYGTAPAVPLYSSGNLVSGDGGDAFRPQKCLSHRVEEYSLEYFPEDQTVLESIDCNFVPCRGKYVSSQALLWVDFSEQVKNEGGGVYAAETYIQVAENCQREMDFYCDRPYRLFVNNQNVLSQAVPQIPVMDEITSRGELRLSSAEYVGTHFTAKLRKGWNRILLVEDCSRLCSCATLVWGVPDEDIVGHCMPDTSALEGWRMRGPLSLPLAVSYPALDVDCQDSWDFLKNENPPQDMSVVMSSYYFVATEDNTPIAERRTGDYRQILSNSRYLVFDFERVLNGYVELFLRGSSGDVVDVVCGGIFSDNRVLPYYCGHRNVTTLTLSGEQDIWVSGYPRGFRYVMLVARTAASSISVDRVSARVDSHQEAKVGSFSCSDETLNAIYETGVNTLESTARGSFIDAPCGEQVQYVCDAMIQSWAFYQTFGITKQTCTALENHVASQYETGEINAVSPSGFFQVLPDYSVMWVVWLHRHILYSGDLRLLDRIFPSVQKLLEYYNGLAIYPDGPLDDLAKFTGVYSFLDYDPKMDRQGIVTGLNALYCRALISGSWLAQQLEKNELADVWTRRASNVASKMRHLAWDSESHLFADSYHDGHASASHSWQTNVLAIYGGLANPAEYDSIWNKFFTDEAPYELEVDPVYNNPYFKYYVLEVAFALNKRVWALSFMRYYWGAMLEMGATTWWELFDPRQDKNSARRMGVCQGAGTSPNGFLITELMGIRPLEPGMTRVVFNPLLNCDVKWAKARIPTIFGHINISWTKQDSGILSVDISANYPLEVIPVLEIGVAKDAEFSLSDEVSLLAEEE